MQTIVMP